MKFTNCKTNDDNQFLKFQVAEALLEKETLNYDDVEKLIGPPPNGRKRQAGIELTAPYPEDKPEAPIAS